MPNNVEKEGNAKNAEKFPPELLAFIDEWKAKRGSLIMILHKTQETFGFISKASAKKLAELTGIPLARIYGVVSFYHFFKTTRPGAYKVSVCLGTACYLKGGADVLEEARKLLAIGPGEVTGDGLFSIDDVRCVGCCGLAPVMTVVDSRTGVSDTYGKMTRDQLPAIFDKYRKAG